ncbi:MULTISPECIES: RagB/SusD family nutrient uptake outer membrane protein [Sphingobacterium]|uniref:RagB/SusD family nutrient uptake outer membrane protein n=1 Tax=Sphingobacterium TaxID=28453 RepID=UPI0013DC184D|nr:MULTISPECIES: RagB/SusD family nutrient uptake outer membrane protein [unclassified Sphingobacterium]
MKNFNRFLLTLGVLTLTSCDKLFDRDPLDKISSGVVWADINLIDANLAQLYAETPFFYNETSNLVNEMAYLGAEAYLVNARNAWIQGTLDQTGGHLEFWAFNQIRNLNTFIENVSKAPIDAKIKDIKIAEARFLRAFDYFEMVKRYGGVPIITQAQSLNTPIEELQVSRNSEQEVYDFIAKECDEIAIILPEVASEYGRITKYTALALNSRAMLYAGSVATYGKQQLDGLLGFATSERTKYWQKSYDASKAIMDAKKFALFNKYPDNKSKNYQYIWLDERNGETIFSKVFNGIGAVGHSFDWYSYPSGFEKGWGADTQAYLETFQAYQKIDGTAGDWDFSAIQTGLHTLDDLFSNRDPRMYASLLHQEAPFKNGKVYSHNGTYLQGTTGPLTISNTIVGPYNGANWYARATSWSKNYVAGTGFPLKKFIDETKDQPQAGESTTDYIVYRYGEVLLNFAEAAFELGKTTEALDHINLIRKRAGMPELTSITREQIRDERQVELMFEGHRFWDLRRWRIATTELSKEMHKIKLNFDWQSKKYQVFVEKQDPVIRSFTEKQYYLPITVNRIANNPKLAPENPGYE